MEQFRISDRQRQTAAVAWVNFVIKHGANLKRISSLSLGDELVVRQVLESAYFHPTKIALGKLHQGAAHDADEVSIVNEWGNIHVFEKDRKVTMATAWFDSFSLYSVQTNSDKIGRIYEFFECIVSKLQMAEPFEPIILPDGKGTLAEVPPTPNPDHGELRFLCRHTRDNDEINRSDAGIHGPDCGGLFCLKKRDKSTSRLICRKCRVTVDFPVWAFTYEILRDGFKNGFKAEPVSENMKRHKRGGRKKASEVSKR